MTVAGDDATQNGATRIGGGQKRRSGRLFARRTVVLAALALGLATLGLGRLTWLDAAVKDVLGDPQHVLVTGTQAAPLSGAIGAVVLAAGIAVSIARPWMRYLTAPLLVLSGVGIIAATLQVVLDPATAAAGAASARTAVAGSVTAVSISPASWAGLPLGSVVAALGILNFLAGPGWSRKARFERPPGSRPLPDSRERESSDEDSADGRARTAAASEASSDGAYGEDRALGELDATSMWDDLSRGDDPTREGRHAS